MTFKIALHPELLKIINSFIIFSSSGKHARVRFSQLNKKSHVATFPLRHRYLLQFISRERRETALPFSALELSASVRNGFQSDGGIEVLELGLWEKFFLISWKYFFSGRTWFGFDLVIGFHFSFWPLSRCQVSNDQHWIKKRKKKKKRRLQFKFTYCRRQEEQESLPEMDV